MLREFRDFIIKGNALDLAIAVILAVAFGAFVVSFTEGIVMALVSAIVGKHDFNALSFDLNGTPIQYGRVLTSFLNLILIGGVLFLTVKAINRARGIKGPTKAIETDHQLLEQIRDELRDHPHTDLPQPAHA